MKRDKVLAILMLAILILCLTACGSSAPSQAPENDPPQTDVENTEPSASITKEKEVTDKEITITVEDPSGTYEIDGYYTGSEKNGQADGQGTFTYWDNNDTYSLKYEGAFSNGTFQGEGKETQKDAEEGYIRVYEGQFMNGNYNGHGTLTVTDMSDNSTLKIVGTFTKGSFTPTAGEAFNFIGQLDVFGTFSLSDNQIEYVDSHPELFPTCNKASADAADLVSFTYKQFTKTRKQEELGPIKLNLVAQQVFEDEFLDGKVTSLLARDTDNNYYTVYYRDSVEVYDGDSFVVWAVPCTTSSFDNIGGGVTTTIVLLACYME